MIDVSDIDENALLAALYNASKQQGMGFAHARGREPMTPEQAAEEILDRRERCKQTTQGRGECKEVYFDYLHGRVMKVDIGGPTLDPWLYDRDNGAGAAAAVVDMLRAGT